MEPKNILNITTREEFRKWLTENHNKESECWMVAKKGKNPPTDCVWYLDAVEEVLCFGWIDTTHKKIEGVDMQRFTPRTTRSPWSELNKERCRRLEKLGLMTAAERLYRHCGFQFVEAKDMFYEDTGWTEYKMFELNL